MAQTFTTLAALLLFFGGAACTKKNPLFCDMNAPCSGAERSFCDIDGAQSSIENNCIAPPEGACNAVEQCSSGMCHENTCVECVNQEDCNDASMICSEDHECVTIACTPGPEGDATCAALAPSLPYCSDDEVCVECLSNATCGEEICDPETFECRACAEHDECDSGLCNLDAGTCRSESSILHLATNGTDSDTCGSLAEPCATLDGSDGALAKIPNGQTGYVLLGAGVYAQRPVISNLRVEIYGNGVASLEPASVSDGNAIVLVTSESEVLLSGIEITSALSGETSVGVRCTATSQLRVEGLTVSKLGYGLRAEGCEVAIDRSTVSENEARGIDVNGGALTLTRSLVSENSLGGVAVDSAAVELTNNVIVANGFFNGVSGSSLGGVFLLNTSTFSQRVDFNTIALNSASSGVSTQLACTAAQAMTSSNILVGASPVEGGDCQTRYSLSGEALTGAENVTGDPMFVNAAGLDFRLMMGSLAIDKADPNATLDVDYLGQPRSDARADIGALEHQP